MNILFPEISVLLPVYNAERFLAKAIDSILVQTFENWELIIVDDASTDSSLQLIEKYNDPRIVLLVNNKNRGISSSLNRAVAQARGRYLARMDADDISRPERLANQYEFLEKHPDIAVCGCWVRCFGMSKQVWCYPQSDAVAKSWLIFEPPFAHSAVMFRHEIFSETCRYNEEFTHAQDYEIWSRLAKDHKFSNLQEVLLEYRIHEDQTGRKQSKWQQQFADRVRISNLEFLGVVYSDCDFELHRNLCRSEFNFSLDSLNEVEAWLLKLYAANKKNAVFDQQAFDFMLGERWWQSCHLACHLGSLVWSVYRKSPFRHFARKSWQDELKFFLRCQLKHPLVG